MADSAGGAPLSSSAALAPASAPPSVPAARSSRNPLRRVYHWILSWANHPWGAFVLGVLSFLDSFIFPIPPLFLQVALSLEKPRRSFFYAFVDTASSVVGSVLGYLIGYGLYASVGKWIIGTWHLQANFDFAGQMFQKNAFVFILIYSFIPFPYKVITIASGVFHNYVGLPTLLFASTIGRGWRFFLLGALCHFWGLRLRNFIEKYFNWVCLGIGVLVVGVLVVMKLFFRSSVSL
jgi:membrane protein YqaA with SNARE-associated domain